MISAVAWVKKGVAKKVPLKYELTEEESKAFIEESNQVIKNTVNELKKKKKKKENKNENFKIQSIEALTTSNKLKGTKHIHDNENGSEKDYSEEENNEENKSVTSIDMNESLEEEDIIKKYQLDDYDMDSNDDDEKDNNRNKKKELEQEEQEQNEDEDEEEFDDTAIEDKIFERVFTNMDKLTMDDGSSKDPYLIDTVDLEEEEEKKDLIIEPNDFLLVIARAPEEDEIAGLEYYVYEENDDNLYVHHDVMLPSYPLCLEWMNFSNDKNFSSSTIQMNDGANGYGNLVAIGTFDPEIEIWNLDYLDPIYPEIILGKDGNKKLEKKKNASKKSMKNKIHTDYHTDAVMCLSWNKIHRQLLASGSADTTIKLWDLSNPSKAIRSYDMHTDKVQSLQWNPWQSTIIASASFDKQLCVFDTRSPSSSLYFSMKSDAEVVKWDPHHENYLALSDDSGMIYYLDSRKLSSTKGSTYNHHHHHDAKKGGTALFSFQAHEKATTGIDFNRHIPSLLVSCSLDKCVKLWDLGNGEMSPSIQPHPQCLIEKNFGQGKLFSCSFSPDSPFLIALSGTKDDLLIWKLNSPSEIMIENQKEPLEKLLNIMKSRLN